MVVQAFAISISRSDMNLLGTFAAFASPEEVLHSLVVMPGKGDFFSLSSSDFSGLPEVHSAPLRRW